MSLEGWGVGRKSCDFEDLVPTLVFNCHQVKFLFSNLGFVTSNEQSLPPPRTCCRYQLRLAVKILHHDQRVFKLPGGSGGGGGGVHICSVPACALGSSHFGSVTVSAQSKVAGWMGKLIGFASSEQRFLRADGFWMTPHIPAILWSLEPERMVPIFAPGLSVIPKRKTRSQVPEGIGTPLGQHSCARGKKGWYLHKDCVVGLSPQGGWSAGRVSQAEAHIENKCQFHSQSYFGGSEQSHPCEGHRRSHSILSRLLHALWPSLHSTCVFPTLLSRD